MKASGKKLSFQTHADHLKVFMYVMENEDESKNYKKAKLASYVYQSSFI